MAKTDEISYYSPSERLLLLYDYMLKHTNKTHVATPKQIHAFLNENGIFIEKKALYADFEKLRSATGKNIVWNPRLRGYQITDPLFEPYELRYIVDSIQSSKFITQKMARQLTKKVLELGDVHTAATLNRQAYVSDRIRNMNESVVKSADRIHEAIEKGEKIGFLYFHQRPSKEHPKYYVNKGKPYIVSPYALLWDDGNYYLYAAMPKGKSFRTFRVDRMENITHPLGEKREGADLFRKEEIAHREYKVFKMYSGEKAKVRVRCNNNITDAVKDKFGDSVILIPDGDDHFITTLPVELSNTFFAWVSTFRRGMKILEPEIAVSKMRYFLAHTLEMYNDDGEKL